MGDVAHVWRFEQKPAAEKRATCNGGKDAAHAAALTIPLGALGKTKRETQSPSK